MYFDMKATAFPFETKCVQVVIGIVTFSYPGWKQTHWQKKKSNVQSLKTVVNRPCSFSPEFGLR
jgi:hypothetical protein